MVVIIMLIMVMIVIVIVWSMVSVIVMIIIMNRNNRIMIFDGLNTTGNQFRWWSAHQAGAKDGAAYWRIWDHSSHR